MVCPVYTEFSLTAVYDRLDLPVVTVTSNLSENHVNIKFMPKLHILGFKVVHRIAQCGIYHVYGYKFRPATQQPITV